MDTINGDDESGGQRPRQRFVRSTPACKAPEDAPRLTVDAESGAVNAVTIGGGPATGSGRRVILRFSWRPSDPLAVVIDIETRPDHPALPRGSWVVLRDFLRYGITEPTGDGDVRISPCGSGVELMLARAQRPCVVVVAAGTLERFLELTEESVPLGEERSDELVHALVKLLLDH